MFLQAHLRWGDGRQRWICETESFQAGASGIYQPSCSYHQRSLEPIEARIEKQENLEHGGINENQLDCGGTSLDFNEFDGLYLIKLCFADEGRT
jgi:hypothetical protein